MACTGRVEHAGSGGSQAAARVSRAGYAYSRMGENVAGGQTSVREAFESWVRSPGHYRNIMEPEVVHMGAAVSTSDKSYYTQVFAAPR